MTSDQFHKIYLKELKSYNKRRPKINKKIIKSIKRYHQSNESVDDLAKLIFRISTTCDDNMFDILSGLLKRSLVDQPSDQRKNQ